MQHTIVVTGASRGIGRSIALEMAKPGVRIAIHYHQQREKAEEVVLQCKQKGADALAFPADLSDSGAVREMFASITERWRCVDILVNNAGISGFGMIQDLTAQRWERIFEVNMHGAFYCTQQAIPAMISQKWGRIINIASMWGQVGASCESAYAASKGALIAFTKSAAKELAYSGITVNAIAPGVVDTDMNQELDEATRKDVETEIPLGRSLHPCEIARWVAHLTSEQAAGITGQIIGINGGMLIF